LLIVDLFFSWFIADITSHPNPGGAGKTRQGGLAFVAALMKGVSHVRDQNQDRHDNNVDGYDVRGFLPDGEFIDAGRAK